MSRVCNEGLHKVKEEISLMVTVREMGLSHAEREFPTESHHHKGKNGRNENERKTEAAGQYNERGSPASRGVAPLDV